MNRPSEARFDAPATLLALEARARQAEDTEALAFVMANETWQLVPYRQAFVFLLDFAGVLRLRVASGLSSVEDDSPFAQFLVRLVAHLSRDAGGPVFAHPESAPERLGQDWAEHLPGMAAWLPLETPRGEVLGGVLYAFDREPDAAATEMLGGLHDAYGHALWALQPRGAQIGRALLRGRRPVLLGLVVALVAAGFVPVPMTALAPAEIAPMHAQIVASPLDGVVRTFHVRPNQAVKRGDPLFTLDDTALRGRRDVASKAADVARAEAMTAAQKAFDSDKHREDMAVLEGRTRQREAETAMIEEMLARVQVTAPRDGIAVFSDENDWLGRPVVTGERIVLLADPGDAGITAWLPVADAIPLEPGARVRLFLHASPLDPLEATVAETSYQAVTAPDGSVAYRVRAAFGPNTPPGRLGFKGTAKLYGERVLLGYLLLRRPLAAVREWTGL